MDNILNPPPGWHNPIVVNVGETQSGVDPRRLLPSRLELVGLRLEAQRRLILSNQPRFTPILVTSGGVIFDGHHAVRAAAEGGRTVEVRVTPASVAAMANSILDLDIR